MASAMVVCATAAWAAAAERVAIFAVPVAVAAAEPVAAAESWVPSQVDSAPMRVAIQKATTSTRDHPWDKPLTRTTRSAAHETSCKTIRPRLGLIESVD